jgi:7-cyano-7-deazaguanine synthase
MTARPSPANAPGHDPNRKTSSHSTRIEGDSTMTSKNAGPEPDWPGGTAPRHVVIVASGGLDSTTLAYWLASRGSRLTMLAVDYGQRHARELQAAAQAATALGAECHVADLRSIGQFLAGSALTTEAIDVPDGHYADETMKATVVPNRNALLLDLGVALAITAGAQAVAYGAHAGDHFIYPDCRPGFVTAYEQMVLAGNDGFLPGGFTVTAPFITMTKAGIAALAGRLDVPIGQTWSCYRGGTLHCGTCGTCTERREALALAGVRDPTEYAGG